MDGLQLKPKISNTCSSRRRRILKHPRTAIYRFSCSRWSVIGGCQPIGATSYSSRLMFLLETTFTMLCRAHMERLGITHQRRTSNLFHAVRVSYRRGPKLEFSFRSKAQTEGIETQRTVARSPSAKRVTKSWIQTTPYIARYLLKRFIRQAKLSKSLQKWTSRRWRALLSTLISEQLRRNICQSSKQELKPSSSTVLTSSNSRISSPLTTTWVTKCTIWLMQCLKAIRQWTGAETTQTLSLQTMWRMEAKEQSWTSTQPMISTSTTMPLLCRPHHQ